MNMDTYDIVMLAVLLIATLFGAWKGFAWQIASLLAIFASCAVAYEFRQVFAAWIPMAAPWNMFLAMLFLYVLTSAAVWVMFQWIASYIDRLKLKEFDRQIGALLGFGKGVIMCVIITLFAVTLLGKSQREAIVQSRSGYCVAILLSKADAVMPEQVRELLGPVLHALDGRLDGAVGTDVGQGSSAAARVVSGRRRAAVAHHARHAERDQWGRSFRRCNGGFGSVCWRLGCRSWRWAALAENGRFSRGIWGLNRT